MKRILLVGCAMVFALAVQAEVVRILGIGNSFTVDALDMPKSIKYKKGTCSLLHAGIQTKPQFGDAIDNRNAPGTGLQRLYLLYLRQQRADIVFSLIQGCFCTAKGL